MLVKLLLTPEAGTYGYLSSQEVVVNTDDVACAEPASVAGAPPLLRVTLRGGKQLVVCGDAGVLVAAPEVRHGSGEVEQEVLAGLRRIEELLRGLNPSWH